MSKISKALERAKRQREGQVQAAPDPFAAAAPAPVEENAAPQDEAAPASAPQDAPVHGADAKTPGPVSAASAPAGEQAASNAAQDNSPAVEASPTAPPPGARRPAPKAAFVPPPPPGRDTLPPAARDYGEYSELATPFGKIMSDGRLAYGAVNPAMVLEMEERRALLERNRIMTFVNDDKSQDYYNFLRTQVLQRAQEKHINAIMVTSVNPGEGKTLTAINLALAISRDSQHNSLLVEANMRHPSVASRLGLPQNALGLSDYVFSDMAISDLLINPGLGNMMRVVLGGQAMAGSTDFLSLPKLRDLIEEFKSRYPDRYVIFDSPHLKQMPDSQIFSSFVDAIVLVVQAGKTNRQEILETLEQLKDKPILGLVFNNSPV